MTSIVIAAPIRPSARSGNDVTAARWARQLTELGHDVDVVAIDESADAPSPAVSHRLDRADVLFAMHARRSAAVVRWWRTRDRDRSLVVALTGTDLYDDMPGDPDSMWSAEQADALIVLQRAAAVRVDGFRSGWGDKTRVVHQSIEPTTVPVRRPVDGELRVVVLAHLREVKDPLLAARAARRLPASSNVRVHHAGRAHDADWAAAAEVEMAANPRYFWHRELDGQAAMNLLATAHVLACTSLSEGGANVVSEALAVGVPTIGTRIEGNTGLLGDDYPGWVPVGDHESMAALLSRLEDDPRLLAELQRRTDRLAALTDPRAERAALADVIAGLPTVSGASA